MMRENQQTVSPPGVLATVGAGFDATAKHLWLVSIPVLLDFFFWLGPRLGFGSLVERLVSFWRDQAVTGGLDVDLLLELAPRTNLLTTLSIPAIGVPAFVVGVVPENTPIPVRFYEIDSLWLWAVLLITLSMIGLMLSALYLGMISLVVRRKGVEAGVNPHYELGRFFARTGWNWLQMLIILVLVFALLVVTFIPLILLSSLLSLWSAPLATLVLFVGPMVVLWSLFYLSFVPHGLILNERPMTSATIESFKLIQRNLVPVLGLLVVIMAVNRLMDWLLLLAEDGGWFTAVSILGHGFVSTSLVTASFIFYRDRYHLLATPAEPAKG
jgi:hypothetical protein